MQIAGLYTTWLTGVTTVDFGPGIVVSNVVVNNDTSITAVLNVDVAAGLGYRTVAVRNVSQAGTQALTGSFQVVSPQPPAPSLQYLSPAAGLRGQTFTINLSAANTHFDPAARSHRDRFRRSAVGRHPDQQLPGDEPDDGAGEHHDCRQRRDRQPR